MDFGNRMNGQRHCNRKVMEMQGGEGDGDVDRVEQHADFGRIYQQSRNRKIAQSQAIATG